MGIDKSWDELKNVLISAGMKPLEVAKYNIDDFKDINWDLKDAREKRNELLANQLTLEEFIRTLSKYKIMDYARNEESTILNSMYGITLSDSEKEHLSSYATYNTMIRNDHEIFSERYKFAQVISFDIKYVEQAKFDVLSRYFNCLVNSIGRAIEEHVIKNAHTGTWPPDFRFVGRTIVSPELCQKYPTDVSYLLKENQILTSRVRKNPPYVVIDDKISFNREHNTIQMTGFVELAFSEEKFTLYEVN